MKHVIKVSGAESRLAGVGVVGALPQLVIRGKVFGLKGVDGAVDYIRCTSKEQMAVQQVSCLPVEVHDVLALLGGGEVPKWREMSVLGYRGRGNESLFEGSGAQGSMVQCSGTAAHYVYPYLSDWNCTRIDVAATFELQKDTPWFGEFAAQAAQAKEASRGATGRKVKLVKGFGDGDTAYIGTRTSDRFIRIYDKGKRLSNEYPEGRLWRVEAEYKGALARKVADRLWSAADDVTEALALVSAELRSLDFIATRWTPPGACRRREQVPVVVPDEESRIRWLKTQVRACVEGLKEEGWTTDHLRDIIGL